MRLRSFFAITGLVPIMGHHLWIALFIPRRDRSARNCRSGRNQQRKRQPRHSATIIHGINKEKMDAGRKEGFLRGRVQPRESPEKPIPKHPQKPLRKFPGQNARIHPDARNRKVKTNPKRVQADPHPTKKPRPTPGKNQKSNTGCRSSTGIM